jgi:hypothetical protein
VCNRRLGSRPSATDARHRSRRRADNALQSRRAAEPSPTEGEMPHPTIDAASEGARQCAERDERASPQWVVGAGPPECARRPLLHVPGLPASVAEAVQREPATILQCRLKYKSPSQQERCIRSLGSSCTHPVMSELSRAFEHLGNRHMEISEEVSKDETPEYAVGPHVEPPEVTNYVSISVTTDSKVSFCEVELITYEGPNGEVVKHHLLHTGPHEGGAYILALTGSGSFLVRSYGRYTHAPHGPTRNRVG